jgi:hypothetical protein
MAIADHMEYRRYEKRFTEYLKEYFPEAITVKHTTKDASDIMVDLNYSVKWAQKYGKEYPVLIIPAAEITRDEGHYNALFSTDNNLIPNNDPLQAIRNAKAQGCLIQHNHPGKRRASVDMTEFENLAFSVRFHVESVNKDQLLLTIVSLVSGQMKLSLGNLHSTIADDIVSTDFEVYVHSYNEIRQLKDALSALPNVYGLRTY